MSKFTRELDVFFEHEQEVVSGKVVYKVPTQLDRIKLAKIENETDVEYSIRINQLVVGCMQSCELSVYKKPSKGKLEDWKKKTTTLELLDKVKDHEEIPYYSFCDALLPLLSAEYAKGSPVGKISKQA